MLLFDLDVNLNFKRDRGHFFCFVVIYLWYIKSWLTVLILILSSLRNALGSVGAVLATTPPMRDKIFLLTSRCNMCRVQPPRQTALLQLTSAPFRPEAVHWKTCVLVWKRGPAPKGSVWFRDTDESGILEGGVKWGDGDESNRRDPSSRRFGG